MYILDDLQYDDKQLARLLDLKPSTIKKYRREGQCPRAVHLALFWESRWGIASIDAVAHNHAAGNYARAESLDRKNARLVKQILSLEKEISEQKKRGRERPDVSDWLKARRKFAEFLQETIERNGMLVRAPH